MGIQKSLCLSAVWLNSSVGHGRHSVYRWGGRVAVPQSSRLCAPSGEGAAAHCCTPVIPVPPLPFQARAFLRLCFIPSLLLLFQRHQAPPTIPALNSACLVPPLRGRGRCQPEPAPRTPRNAWAVSGTALPPPPVVQLGLSGCHLQPPWLAAPGKLVPVPAAGGGARRLCSLPLAGAGSAGRAGNSPG